MPIERQIDTLNVRMYTIVIEAPTPLNRTVCRVAERFRIENQSGAYPFYNCMGMSHSSSVISSSKEHRAKLRHVIESNLQILEQVRLQTFESVITSYQFINF